MTAWTVFRVMLTLGCTSFGGPVAHIGYFRDELVARRKWLDERAYADMVVLAQFLPGPASSQVSFGIGLTKAGLPGGIAAFLGFTLPAAVLMILFGYGVTAYGVDSPALLKGFKVAAVAVVAYAVWSMARSLWPAARHASIGVLAAAVLLCWPVTGLALVIGQVAVIALGAAAGHWLLPRDALEAPTQGMGPGHSRRTGAMFLAAFAVLLLGLPLLAWTSGDFILSVADAFYRSGALVFGGGHVVLPLLQAETVQTGWVSREAFLAGYGAAQAVPGPLFTFSAFLGTSLEPSVTGGGAPWLWALLCLVAIFLPGFLLMLGALPFWNALRARPEPRAALAGVNAAVVGLLLAALYDPVWTAAIGDGTDVALMLVTLLMLAVWKLPAWLVVILAASAGWGLAALGV